MKRNNIMYENLRVEMARRNLAIMDIARETNMNRDTLSRKLSGKSPLYLDEAFKIQMSLFADVEISELFKESARREM